MMWMIYVKLGVILSIVGSVIKLIKTSFSMVFL